MSLGKKQQAAACWDNWPMRTIKTFIKILFMNNNYYLILKITNLRCDQRQNVTIDSHLKESIFDLPLRSTNSIQTRQRETVAPRDVMSSQAAFIVPATTTKNEK